MVCQGPVTGQFYIALYSVCLQCIFSSGTWEVNSKRHSCVCVFFCCCFCHMTPLKELRKHRILGDNFVRYEEF